MSFRWWIAASAACAGALLCWGAAALAAGGSAQATLQVSVTVTPGVTLKLFNSPISLKGTCQPGNGTATCSATNAAQLVIDAPNATTFALSAFDTNFTDSAGDTIPGSALVFSPCVVAASCFQHGYVYDHLSTHAASPTLLWTGAPLASSGSTYVTIGNIVGFAESVWATMDIPANAAAGTYSNTVTLLVTAT